MISLLFALQVAVAPSHVESVRAKAPAIREALNRELIDYPAARFRDVRVTVNMSVAAPRAAYLCGYVNARNRMGGYTGWSRFMATADEGGGLLVLASAGSASDIVLSATCDPDNLSAADPADRSGWLTHR